MGLLRLCRALVLYREALEGSLEDSGGFYRVWRSIETPIAAGPLRVSCFRFPPEPFHRRTTRGARHNPVPQPAASGRRRSLWRVATGRRPGRVGGRRWLLAMRAGAALRLCSRPELLYRQGQRPGPGLREYFYYVDDHGQVRGDL